MLYCKHVGELHVSVLKLGSLMLFNWVMELSQDATLLVLSEVKDHKVTIMDDYQAFTVGIWMMSLDLLQEGLGKVINMIWMAYRDIVQCNQVVLEGIRAIDDLLNDLWG
jgi:hypothetical protein